MILYLTSRHSNEKTMVRLPYPCHHLPPPATSPPHTPHATPCNDIIFYVLTIFFFCLLFSTSFVALILLIPFFNVFLSLLLWLCFGKMQNKNSSSSHNPASRPFLLLPLPLPGHSLSLCFFFCLNTDKLCINRKQRKGPQNIPSFSQLGGVPLQNDGRRIRQS